MAKRSKGENVHGFLNFYKPVGMTSNQAVGFARRVFNAKKAGHGGTLDPLAEGVLPIALGEATKMLSYMLTEDKYYQFEMTFGEERTTDDAEGEVTQTSNNRPTKEQLNQACQKFIGEISQTPPVFSALKINGKRACDRVRAGEEVTLQPRQVIIHSIIIDKFTPEKALLSVHVSKGTYVRSLCKDIGRKLGCYAYVSQLIRTQVPPFDIKDAVHKEKLDECVQKGQSAKTYLLDVDHVLDDIPVYTASGDEVKTILSGQTLTGEGSGVVRVKTQEGVLVSLAQYENGVIKPQKNFPLLLNDIDI